MSPSPPFVEFPRAAFERSVPERFEEIARRHGDRLALKDRGRALTYAELDRAANRLARAMLARRGPAAEPVALLFDHGVPAIVAIIAALKAGKLCVVLDATHPVPRLAAMLDDAEAVLVVHGRGHAALAERLAGRARGVLDAERSEGALDTAPPGIVPSPRALAYISYTSGTTGTPKGVLVDHRGIIHRSMAYVNSLRVGPADRLTLVHGLGVGGSLRQLWGGLLAGATVCPFDLRREGVGPMPRWLDAEGITLAHFPASAFRHFASGLPAGTSFAAVRSVTVSNEPVFPSDLELFRRHFPSGAVFVSMLGITEAGNVAQYVVDGATPLPEDFLPVGFPLPDKEVLLLDDAGAPVRDDAVGEIAVRSEFLSPGYWRRPDAERAVFLPDPDGGSRRIYRTGDLGRWRADGALLHLGRRDAMPKLRGQFVDALEVERRLLGHPSVSQAVVAIREDRLGDQRLVAYVVPAREPVPTGPELRRFARETLPGHMVPSLFVLLPELPRTTSGKVDRRALPAPGAARPALGAPAVAPRTAIEGKLAEMWARILGVREVGVEDDFFDLGGHSLLATRLGNEVRDALGVEVSLAALLGAGTVAQMATLVVAERLAALTPGERARLLDEPAAGASPMPR